MDVKSDVVDAARFSGGFLLFILMLVVWRIVFTLVAGASLLAWLVPAVIVALGLSAAGLTEATVFAISTVVFVVTLPAGGLVLKRFGYTSPKVNVDFSYSLAE